MVMVWPVYPVVGLKLVTTGREPPGIVTLKGLEEVVFPPGVTTWMGPVVAPAGTVAVICVALLVVKEAADPLKLTPVAPLKFPPVRVTVVPAGPERGENPVKVGGWRTVKDPVEVAVPPGVVMETEPLVASGGRVAWTWESLSRVKTAAKPLNFTEVAPAKWDPAKVMTVPGIPDAGVKEVRRGGWRTVKGGAAKVKVPPGVLTATNPVVAPEGTVAIMEESLPTEKVPASPLKLTRVAPVK